MNQTSSVSQESLATIETRPHSKSDSALREHDKISTKDVSELTSQGQHNATQISQPQFQNILQREKSHSLSYETGRFTKPCPPLVNSSGSSPKHELNPSQASSTLSMPLTPNNGPIPSHMFNSIHSNPYYTLPLASKNSPFYPLPQQVKRFNSMDSSLLRSSYSRTPGNKNSTLIRSAGRKKALLIGIKYFGTEYELKGCINDVKNIKEFLLERYRFPLDGMVILTDDQKDNPARMPTKKNIIDAMEWLVDGARLNDSLFLHFSGHGAQIPDLDGDEDDGFDETICPVDFQTEGMIVDDDMNKILVQPLPAGCRLTVLFDCCHSGTALDLPYVYDSSGELQTFHHGNAMMNALVNFGAKTQVGDIAGAFNSFIQDVKFLVNGKKTELSNQKVKGGRANVIMFSGCEDSQLSADLKSDNMNTGALSLALIAALRSSPSTMSYLELLNKVRQFLVKNNFPQTPQLSTACPMDMNTFFHI